MLSYSMLTGLRDGDLGLLVTHLHSAWYVHSYIIRTIAFRWQDDKVEGASDELEIAGGFWHPGLVTQVHVSFH